MRAQQQKTWTLKYIRMMQITPWLVPDNLSIS
jgi:hypothetical protein